jgi:hypothetical protein
MACASAPPPAPPAPPPIVAPAADLPRSSIAAILAHRVELGLTSGQVDALSRRDDALAKEDAALRARLATTSTSGPASPPASPSTGGRHGRRGGGQRAPTAAHGPDALTQLDDNDTKAYLEIEDQVLTESQRPRAREIASAYREALYDRQHPSASRGGEDAGSSAR